MTLDEILALLLINISIATSVLRQLGFVISSLEQLEGGRESLYSSRTSCS